MKLQNLDNLYLDNHFKVVIFNASESKDNNATIPGVFVAEVSIFGRDYVHTDTLVDGILQMFENNQSQFKVWDRLMNVDKLHSTRITRLEEGNSNGSYASHITGNLMTHIYESEKNQKKKRINDSEIEILDYNV